MKDIPPLPFDQEKNYVQIVTFKLGAYFTALEWPGIRDLLGKRTRYEGQDTHSRIGIGKYFEPLRTNDADCFCVEEGVFLHGGRDLSTLVELLRSKSNVQVESPFEWRFDK